MVQSTVERGAVPQQENQKKHEFTRRLEAVIGRPSTLDVGSFFTQEQPLLSLDDPLLPGQPSQRRVLIQILTAVARKGSEGVALEAGNILIEPTVFDALRRLEHIHFDREGGNKGVKARVVSWYTYYDHQGCDDMHGMYDVRVVSTTQTVEVPPGVEEQNAIVA